MRGTIIKFIVLKLLFLALVAVLVYMGMQHRAKADEPCVVRIAGSTTVYKTLFENRQTELEKQIGCAIHVLPVGSSRGLAALRAAQADIAMISAPLADLVRESKIQPDRLESYSVGYSELVPVVNNANPLHALPAGALRDILTGKITNWSALGGPDMPVRVVVEYAGGGTRKVLEDSVLGKAPLAHDAEIMPNATQISTVVAQIHGAIGFTNTAYLKDDVHIVKTDQVFSQPLSLVMYKNRTTIGASPAHRLVDLLSGLHK